jgi:tRNA threonylcarbamoyladenosine biosynthesis protein TsaB
MRMPFLLLLETSSKNCSVAIADEQQVILAKSASADHFIHAEQLHVMMNELFTESTLRPDSLHAVAVSKGPGSYTGLRIGVSAAKGLCFALKIPLIAIDTTEILARHAASIIHDATHFIPMIDARRMEVYSANFDAQAKRLTADEAVIIDENTFNNISSGRVVLVGDGAEKCKPFLKEQMQILSILPSADMMHAPAIEAFHQKQFEDVAYFEPFYLKDYIPGTSRKSVL